jgi:hypothetical protein
MNWEHHSRIPPTDNETLSTELFPVKILLLREIAREIEHSHPATPSYSPQNPHSQNTGEELSNPISHQTAPQRLELRWQSAATPRLFPRKPRNIDAEAPELQVTFPPIRFNTPRFRFTISRISRLKFTSHR